MRVLLPESPSSVGQDSSDPIAEILKKYKTIAVVGLSSNPLRPSYEVSAYMQSAGYRIIPVNPNETKVLGEESYARLEDVPEKIDVVNVFRRAEEAPPVVESAIRIGAKVVWMQLGIENKGAAERARAAGLVVIEDACILVEHRKRAETREQRSEN
jgi:predicted CoA-binding protein